MTLSFPIYFTDFGIEISDMFLFVVNVTLLDIISVPYAIVSFPEYITGIANNIFQSLV